MALFEYNPNTEADAAAGAGDADRCVAQVLHGTFVAERDPTTCFTLIVHSESMEERTIAALHEACLEAVKRISAADWRR